MNKIELVELINLFGKDIAEGLKIAAINSIDGRYEFEDITSEDLEDYGFDGFGEVALNFLTEYFYNDLISVDNGFYKGVVIFDDCVLKVYSIYNMPREYEFPELLLEKVNKWKLNQFFTPFLYRKNINDVVFEIQPLIEEDKHLYRRIFPRDKVKVTNDYRQEIIDKIYYCCKNISIKDLNKLAMFIDLNLRDFHKGNFKIVNGLPIIIDYDF